ncbi:unnamed protein product [Ceratitis capitata]|uniref:(Mediterranean fruit fly) hypothetical protein n=1 Tax=Ceratitis capitata TaxID=7213 RepID=A0A811U585_CERCA|nr:unnamed protein product [Ceratitis capitata]
MIPVTGMVDSFQKQYVSLKVPYPADNVSSEVDAQIKKTKNEIDNFEKSSQARIDEYQKTLDPLNRTALENEKINGERRELEAPHQTPVTHSSTAQLVGTYPELIAHAYFAAYQLADLAPCGMLHLPTMSCRAMGISHKSTLTRRERGRARKRRKVCGSSCMDLLPATEMLSVGGNFGRPIDRRIAIFSKE